MVEVRANRAGAQLRGALGRVLEALERDEFLSSSKRKERRSRHPTAVIAYMERAHGSVVRSCIFDLVELLGLALL